ncbi:hypothetical protein ZHAS_00012197 [Anopheles sinensis]|uniref:Uncharacterized protein n=1 Tax=Anopheles sinensis TaxID=74873 RepID=A0A084W2H1_ANOSI|nr:hypothetical protein ZHAS_00012197 [Anopheles sinensis]
MPDTPTECLSFRAEEILINNGELNSFATTEEPDRYRDHFKSSLEARVSE